MRRSSGGYAMIIENIKTDVFEEFLSIKESLQIYLKPDFDVSQTKRFLQTYVPKEVIYKSETLLDTLMNYLMKDAREKIKSADIELQNTFFDMDFRKRIREWAKQLQNNLALEPDIVKYSTDPCLKSGLIVSGITFLSGTGITTAVVSGIIGSILSGITTIILTAMAFKIAYNKASPRAREVMGADIDQYLASSQEQVFAWLKTVADAFNNDFHAFCTANGFILDGETRE